MQNLSSPFFLSRPCRLLLAAVSIMGVQASGAEHAPGAPVGSAASARRPLRIVLIGDSTVCNYDANLVDRGWGMYIAEAFKPGAAEVLNLAAGGRSTKTFIAEGRWKQALAAKPDVVLIQFGHNDSHAPEKPESTQAATDYSEFLRRYIDEARAGGAHPVLVTPVVRRNFNAEGRFQDILAPYAEAMRGVAKEKGAAVVDLFASSRDLVLELGPEKCQTLANHHGDRTHFNEKGARTMAALVLRELPAAAPQLRPLLLSADVSAPR